MLEWTHDSTTCPDPDCDGDTDCDRFPTVNDRIAMAEAAYEEYAGGDGTVLSDFVLDVLLFLKSNGWSLKDIKEHWKSATQELKTLTRPN